MYYMLLSYNTYIQIHVEIIFFLEISVTHLFTKNYHVHHTMIDGAFKQIIKTIHTLCLFTTLQRYYFVSLLSKKYQLPSARKVIYPSKSRANCSGFFSREVNQQQKFINNNNNN